VHVVKSKRLEAANVSKGKYVMASWHCARSGERADCLAVGLAIVHCARKGNEVGTRQRAASPSHAACTRP